MTIIKIAIFLALFLFFAGLSPIDVSRYGSSILICAPEGVMVKYWTATRLGSKDRAGTEDFVFDLMSRKTYPFNACEIYECSPDPGRMNKCMTK